MADIAELFQRNFADFAEIGAAVSIWHHDEEVLSLHGGWMEPTQERKWGADTLVPVWSATKGPAVATTLLALARAGRELSACVADIWPEFAVGQPGKSQITVGQLLSHQAGLAALDEKVSITDADAVLAALARQAPLWAPGSGHGYHPRTFGFLLEALTRQLTGRTLAQYWREEIAEPAQLDFWLGLPEAEFARVATVVPAKMRVGAARDNFQQAFNDPLSLTRRAFTSPQGLTAITEFNRPATWQLGIASMGGVTSARGLAKFYSLLAGQGGGIFPQKVLDWLANPLVSGEDRVLLLPTSFSAGCQLDPISPVTGEKLRRHYGPSRRAFGHPGAGGSFGFADPDNGLAFAYVMNQLESPVSPGPRCLRLVEALYAQGMSKVSGPKSDVAGGLG